MVNFYIIETILIVLVVLAALLAIINTKLAIALQQAFYAKINWKIEPLSYEKELRNTKIIGFLSLIICGLTALVLIKAF